MRLSARRDDEIVRCIGGGVTTYVVRWPSFYTYGLFFIQWFLSRGCFSAVGFSPYCRTHRVYAVQRLGRLHSRGLNFIASEACLMQNQCFPIMSLIWDMCDVMRVYITAMTSTFWERVWVPICRVWFDNYDSALSLFVGADVSHMSSLIGFVTNGVGRMKLCII